MSLPAWNERRARRLPQIRPGTHPGASRRTREQLYEEARERNIPGRSMMTKAELARLVDQ
jgi:hypothetical protein